MLKDELVKEFNSLNENSTLKDLQNYVIDMMKYHNFNNTPLELFCYLGEEIGELAKEIRKTQKGMELDISKDNNPDLKHELADVFIYILALANTYNIDLLKAFKDKEKINLERVWK